MTNLLVYAITVGAKDQFELCAINTTTQQVSIITDRDEACLFWEANNKNIWVCANRNEQETLLKTLIYGLSITRIKASLDEGKSPNEISRHFAKVKVFGYDVLKDIPKTLNQVSGSLGLCIMDNSAYANAIKTLEILHETLSNLEASIDIVKEFHLPLTCIGQTKQQLAGTVLKPSKVITDQDIFRYIEDKALVLNKYKDALDFFKTITEDNKATTMQIYGLEHSLSMGGLHAGGKYTGEGYFVQLDVVSMYPNIIVNKNLLTRSVDDNTIYKSLLTKRIAYKKEGKKVEKAFKLIINSAYGAMNYKNSTLYDPLMANNVCYSGQLSLIDLLEKIEESFGKNAELIQTNTDGIFLKLANGEMDLLKLKEVVNEWTSRHGLEIEYVIFTKIFQKDVNNYVYQEPSGKIKRKGDWFKDIDRINNNMGIIRKAVSDYLIYGNSIKKTVNECNDPKMFQMILTTGKFDTFVFAGSPIPEDTIRVFASKDGHELLKKKDGGKAQKIANCPSSVFIYNGNTENNVEIIERIDKDFYIESAKERLKSLI